MAIRQIAKRGESEILKKKSREVTEINGRIHELIEDMCDTLELSGGVGLAAPQVSVLKRVILVSMGEDTKYKVFINPRIVEKEGEQLSIEGCLSIDCDIYEVIRPTKVTVEAQDKMGNKIIVTGSGDIAIRLCHEIDHLDGITIADIGKLYKRDDEEQKG